MIEQCIIFGSRDNKVIFAFCEKNDPSIDEDEYCRYDMVHNEVSLGEAEQLLDLVCLQQTRREEVPDDFIAHIWIGKKIIRCGGLRLYIDLSSVHDQLYAAISSVNANQKRENKFKDDLDSVLFEVVENLNL